MEEEGLMTYTAAIKYLDHQGAIKIFWLMSSIFIYSVC